MEKTEHELSSNHFHWWGPRRTQAVEIFSIFLRRLYNDSTQEFFIYLQNERVEELVWNPAMRKWEHIWRGTFGWWWVNFWVLSVPLLTKLVGPDPGTKWEALCALLAEDFSGLPSSWGCSFIHSPLGAGTQSCFPASFLHWWDSLGPALSVLLLTLHPDRLPAPHAPAFASLSCLLHTNDHIGYTSNEGWHS